ncbi:MAG TPA: helix-turn-helix domain-containing protein [Thermoanaerobaculia bacterium]|nr:helix-turn-helix domain-containing protein [Thermoanaerobaculia bacterium]
MTIDRSTSRPPRTAFGEVLRTYRRGTGQPQLEAALSAGISQRHLSFLETGRAQPSRGVVLALGGTLGLSLPQQNELLLAAGYAPIFKPERDPKELELIERALLAFLDVHEPFPALLLDEGVWIKKGNRGAARLWSAVRGVPIPEVPQDNIFEVMLRRGPGREKLENWSEAAACLLRRYMAEQARSGRGLSEAAAALARNREVKRLLRQDPEAPPPPVVLLKYRFDDARLNLFIVIASLQAPLDTRLEDLRVELFIPADEATAEWFRREAQG